MGHRGIHEYSAASPDEPKIFITRGAAWVVDEKTERAFQVEDPEEISRGFSPRYTSVGYYQTSSAGRKPCEEASLNTYYGTPPNEHLHPPWDRYLQEYKRRRVTRGERIYA
jgi:hypothetical protein